ncbi:hypothetical protein Tco_1345879 [Tanacetum coccineum]
MLQGSAAYFRIKPAYLDEEEVLDDEEETQVKVLMALADDELTVGKNLARNGEWIDITIKRELHQAQRSVSGTVTVSETERTIPSVPAEVKNTEQESKINE